MEQIVLRMVGKDNLYNYLKIDGTLLSHQWFDEVKDFKNGFALVKLNDEYNFINTDGKLIYEQWFYKVGHNNLNKK